MYYNIATEKKFNKKLFGNIRKPNRCFLWYKFLHYNIFLHINLFYCCRCCFSPMVITEQLIAIKLIIVMMIFFELFSLRKKSYFFPNGTLTHNILIAGEMLQPIATVLEFRKLNIDCISSLHAYFNVDNLSMSIVIFCIFFLYK